MRLRVGLRGQHSTHVFAISRARTSVVRAATVILLMAVLASSLAGQSALRAQGIQQTSRFSTSAEEARHAVTTPTVNLFTDLGPPSDPYNCCSGWTVAGSGSIGTSFVQANAFTVSGSGTFAVTQIDLGVNPIIDPNTFQSVIYTDAGGVPGIPVGNTCFSFSGVAYPGLVTVPGITNVSLLGGRSYFMILGPLNLTDNTFGSWNFNNQNVYGLDLYSTDGGTTWNGKGTTARLGAMDIQGYPAQGSSVVYDFGAPNSLLPPNGAFPNAGLTFDKAGNLYGTLFGGGDPSCNSGLGCGTVFKLTPQGSSWSFTKLYNFAGGSDGWGPVNRLVWGPDGNLYGVTEFGGGAGCGGNGCGTAFSLTPPSTVFSKWTEKIIHGFKGGSDGAAPTQPDSLTFDQAGNLYGTTSAGGLDNAGTVYQLMRSGGSWVEKLVYSFTGGNDGGTPESGVIFDKLGNLHGTTALGGTIGLGAIYELAPSGSGWNESVLYNFAGASDGYFPDAGLVFDNSGNLFGATTHGPTLTDGGVVFELSPSGSSWVFNVVYALPGGPIAQWGPMDTLLVDGVGNLYGATLGDGAYGGGTVFKLAPSSGTWTYTDIHDFSSPPPVCGDGSTPIDGLVMDKSGNLYGTTTIGGFDNGYHGWGSVFEITP